METGRLVWARILLMIGGLLSAAMAGYHFILPYQFGWGRFVKDIPSVIRWALFSINFFFSFLLLIFGVLVILLACSRRHASPVGGWIIAGAAAFWAVNLCYQLICPMPLPASMMVLRVGLPAYALLALLLHVVSIVPLVTRADGAPGSRKT